MEGYKKHSHTPDLYILGLCWPNTAFASCFDSKLIQCFGGLTLGYSLHGFNYKFYKAGNQPASGVFSAPTWKTNYINMLTCNRYLLELRGQNGLCWTRGPKCCMRPQSEGNSVIRGSNIIKGFYVNAGLIFFRPVTF